jgi:hypothetical protein
MIEPVTIAPDGVYDDTSLYETVGLTPTALATARRAGTLRYTRQGKRTLYLGRWIIDWLEAAAVKPTDARQAAAGQGDEQ